MSQIVRHLLAAAGIAALHVGAATVPFALAVPALARDEAPKDIALTQKLIDSWIVAQKPLQVARSASGTGDSSDLKVQTKLESIAKANGFTDLAEYNRVTEAVAKVVVGVDPDTKTYLGPASVIKKQMAEVEADTKLKPADKTIALDKMKVALIAVEATPPSPHNVAIVTKNYGKLLEAWGNSHRE